MAGAILVGSLLLGSAGASLSASPAAAATAAEAPVPTTVTGEPGAAPAVDKEDLDAALEQLRLALDAHQDIRSVWDTADADRIDTAARLGAARRSLASTTAGSAQEASWTNRRDRLEQSLHDAEQVTALTLLQLSAAQEAVRVEAGAATELIAASGTEDLPAEVLLAQREVVSAATALMPQCGLPGAALSALGRSRVAAIGRSGTPVDPVLLHELAGIWARTDARAICDASQAQDTPTDLDARIIAAIPKAGPLGNERTADLQDGPQVVLASARRYARNPVLGLGLAPTDTPALSTIRTAPGPERAATGGDGPGASKQEVADLISWGTQRLGTPYSQCLGASRPSDPVCPPGTDRFGDGFFDCSGFVHAAFASIGVDTPTTTTAMQFDEEFLSHTVSTGFDDGARPGDIFLMEGHTGIVVDGGRIMHASADGLVVEPLPTWVRERTFAIVRLTSPA